MSKRERLASAIAHATHVLPSQGPISIFVHHNTLHSLESLPFEKAVIEGGRLYGCEPYLSEDRYRDELLKGRISVDDLRQSLMDDLGDDADELIAIFGTRYTLRLSMLQTTLHTAPDAELHWLLAETGLLRRFRDEVSPPQRERIVQHTKTWVLRLLGARTQSPSNSGAASEAFPAPLAVVESLIKPSRRSAIESWSAAEWESFALQLMWRICRHGVEITKECPPASLPSPSLSKLLRESIGEDTDRTVNEVLIRFCGGFLDQGFANWPLPLRDQGFAKAFARLFSQRMTVTPSWMAGIRDELTPILAGPFDPLASIAESLEALGVGEESFDGFIEQSLLALRGWAGMIWQMETRAPRLPNPTPPGTLHEYLAIRLLLQRRAIADVGQRRFGTRDIAQIRRMAAKRRSRSRGPSIDQRTHVLFQLAQAGGWTPEQLHSLTEPQWSCLLREVELFTSGERRRIWHRAYERHYRIQTLDAVAVHAKRRQMQPRSPDATPAFTAIFCIDDREESFRRHLEEVDPECTTESAAGFYAVAMYYQGADHANFRPLCPGIIVPKHYVREKPMFSAIDDNERRARRRRTIGQLTHQIHASSRTLVGGWVTGVFGAMATFPMVARIMAPRFTSQVREAFGTWVKPPATELHLERTTPEPGPEPESIGYSLDEMAGIVVRILQDIGLVRNLPPIVVFFGHGSSSLNNPHASAYNCGACSGGRGGPNARAFAMMANDPRVRRLTAENGLTIPEDVRFIGAFHNTCNDKVEYYDLDRLPHTHRGLFRRVEKSVDETRARNAHERSRRFELASLDLTPAAALEHVEQRAEDLSQARPEYNHATNALLFVGRREWSRGLFADRRVFLTTYDPRVDDEDSRVLTRILQAAIPVCAGISLEYYFSTVDVEGYGCGSKLPQNIASLIGVMTGASSDLRPGLSQQMIEIHEPMRLLSLIETTPERMHRIIDANPGIAALVNGDWVQLALLDPETSAIQFFVNGKFEPYSPESAELSEVASSIAWYRGHRDHLGFTSITEGTNRLVTTPAQENAIMPGGTP